MSSHCPPFQCVSRATIRIVMLHRKQWDGLLVSGYTVSSPPQAAGVASGQTASAWNGHQRSEHASSTGHSGKSRAMGAFARFREQARKQRGVASEAKSQNGNGMEVAMCPTAKGIMRHDGLDRVTTRLLTADQAKAKQQSAAAMCYNKEGGGQVFRGSTGDEAMLRVELERETVTVTRDGEIVTEEVAREKVTLTRSEACAGTGRCLEMQKGAVNGIESQNRVPQACASCMEALTSESGKQWGGRGEERGREEEAKTPEGGREEEPASALQWLQQQAGLWMMYLLPQHKRAG